MDRWIEIGAKTFATALVIAVGVWIGSIYPCIFEVADNANEISRSKNGGGCDFACIDTSAPSPHAPLIVEFRLPEVDLDDPAFALPVIKPEELSAQPSPTTDQPNAQQKL